MSWFTIREEPKKLESPSGKVGSFGPSGSGVWSSPTLDVKRGLLYVTTGDNFSSPPTDMSDAVLAMDLKTGRIVWSRQVTPNDIFSRACSGGMCPGPDFDFGSSILIEKLPNGRDVLLAGQKSGLVFALDPERKGEILWQIRVGKGGTNGGVQWGMSSDGENVYTAVSDLARKAPPGTVVQVDLPPDPAEGGGPTALRISSGDKVCRTACVRSQTVVQSCATPGCHGNPGHRVFGIRRRTPQGVYDRRRKNTLGLRHGARVSDRERSSR